MTGIIKKKKNLGRLIIEKIFFMSCQYFGSMLLRKIPESVDAT